MTDTQNIIETISQLVSEHEELTKTIENFNNRKLEIELKLSVVRESLDKTFSEKTRRKTRSDKGVPRKRPGNSEIELAAIGEL